MRLSGAQRTAMLKRQLRNLEEKRANDIRAALDAMHAKSLRASIRALGAEPVT